MLRLRVPLTLAALLAGGVAAAATDLSPALPPPPGPLVILIANALDGDPLSDLPTDRRVAFVMGSAVVCRWSGAVRHGQ